MTNKVEDLISYYEDAFDDYGEALQNTAQHYWSEKYGEDCWEEFHNLDRKLKVKFYYEES